ncbi:uncharacterized protein [Euphorbia lathyris]|uniref:uncharacterized protein isoform X2 n=1 Tax=Euphorbia lathyris TaxID=212925 RepID=UPI003314444B
MAESGSYRPSFMYEDVFTGVKYPAVSFPRIAQISQQPEEGTLLKNSNRNSIASSSRLVEDRPYLQQFLNQSDKHNPRFISDDFWTGTRHPADSYPGATHKSHPPKEGTLTLLNNSNLNSNPSSLRFLEGLPYLQQLVNESDRHNPRFIDEDFWSETRHPANSYPRTAQKSQPLKEHTTMNNLNLNANVAYSRLVQDNHYLQQLLNKSDKHPGDSNPRISQNFKCKAQMNMKNSHSNFNSGASSSRVHEDPGDSNPRISRNSKYKAARMNMNNSRLNFNSGGSSSRVHEDPQLPIGNYENSAETMATVTKVAQLRPKRLWPGSRRILHDRTSIGYDWLHSGWLCEERIMAHRRVYRYYYDPIGRLYYTQFDAKVAMSRLNNNI